MRSRRRQMRAAVSAAPRGPRARGSPVGGVGALQACRVVEKVDGILLLDKPEGMTSNAALQAAKRLLGAQKAGHGGTLDPLATGLLTICFGEATKFSAVLLDAEKTYAAQVRLGVNTAHFGFYPVLYFTH